jgi:hypothetical protein
MSERAQRNPLSFRSAKVEAEVERRVGEELTRPGVCARDMARYYAGLARARAEIQGKLVASELLFLADALHDAALDGDPYDRILPLVKRQAGALRLEEKWGVRADHLLGVLGTLPDGVMLALADGIEQFWLRFKPTLDPIDGLREVGLLPLDEHGLTVTRWEEDIAS